MHPRPTPSQSRTDGASTRTWGLSRPLWALVAGFCLLAEAGGQLATGGRLNGWSNILFIIAFAAVGLVAFINAVRPVPRRE